MLQGGDEMGRTQSGNNNAYCQDNELTWLDWQSADKELVAFTAGLIQLRKRFGQLSRNAWLTGQSNASGGKDVIWWHPDGHEMTEHDWHALPGGALGMLLSPDETPSGVTEGESKKGETLLVLFNRNREEMAFRLPSGHWRQVCCSSDDAPFIEKALDTLCSLPGRSVLLLARG